MYISYYQSDKQLNQLNQLHNYTVNEVNMLEIMQMARNPSGLAPHRESTTYRRIQFPQFFSKNASNWNMLFLKGMSNIVELLIFKEVAIDSHSKFKWTPLMQTCTRGPLEICLLLLSDGANHDIKNNDGLTVLLLPTSKDFHGIVELLTTYGAGYNTQDNIESTSLKQSEK